MSGEILIPIAIIVIFTLVVRWFANLANTQPSVPVDDEVRYNSLYPLAHIKGGGRLGKSRERNFFNDNGFL